MPLIVSHSRSLPKGKIVSEFSSIVDITPTILDLANIPHPGNSFNGNAIHGMDGRSILPFLQGNEETIYPPGEGNGFELFGHNAFISENWKITRLQEPYGDFVWGLYDLNTDPAELNDLSTVIPEKFQEMKLLYNDYAERNGVIQVPEGWRMFENLGTSQD